MKTIFRIVKNELKMLFCSPIAWLILVIFAFQAGMVFCDLLGTNLKYVVLGNSLRNLTDNLFSVRGVYTQIQNNLYLYIPLLTMGIMSREYNSGSIKLLYSSPITNAQIILGKYMALMVYAAALLGALLIIIAFAGFTVESLDWGPVFSGLLALYLLACTYCAIGLYMSTITSYQVVAVMGTLAVLAALNFINQVGQDIEWVREITYWLSISGRASEAITGLVCSEDIIYFVVVTVLFLSLSILKLKFERGKESNLKMTLHYLCIVAVVVAIAFVSSRPKLLFYADVTQTKHKSLTPASQAVMKEIGDRKLKITTYVNLLEKNYYSGSPKQQLGDMKRFEMYQRYNPNIEMDYVYYWQDCENSEWETHYPDMTPEERARHLTDAWKLNYNDFLTPEELSKQIDLSGEEFRFTRLIEDENGQKTFLRIYDDMSRFPNEGEITAALRRLTVEPTLYSFLYGHGERDIFSYSDEGYQLFARQNGFRHSLINQGFDTDSLSLAFADETANGADVIVIADPKKPYTDEELRQLDFFIETGKNFLIAGKPENREFLNPILSKFGVELTEGTLVTPNKEFSPDLILGHFTPQGRTFSPVLAYLDRLGYVVTAPGTAGIQKTADKGFHVVPIVTADSTLCWNELQAQDFVNETPTFNPEKGEVDCKGMPIVSLLARELGDKKLQKVLVLGSADCISNVEFSKGRNGVRPANYDLLLQTGLWFSEGYFPINANRPNRPDNKIKNVKYSQMIWVKIGFMGVIPILLTVFGFMIWYRRGRN